MKLDQFPYLYSKPLGNHTLKNFLKIPGNLLKKTWKNHGNIMEFCQSKKVGTLQDYVIILLVWDQTKLSRFNWLWNDCTTFDSYSEETSYENSLLVQQSGKMKKMFLGYYWDTNLLKKNFK